MISTLSKLSLVALAIASPVKKRAIDDATILQYALTLEHLEATFYAQALTKFSAADFKANGQPDWVRQRLTEIGLHEAEHVKFLSDALTAAGASPVKACTYDFGLKDIPTFFATASVLEGVGVSAYLGAAKNISNVAYLTYAGAVLTVESRHSSWIRADVLHGDGFPTPFDSPLEFNQVYSLAAAFIKSCPSSNAALPVKAFPALKFVKATDSTGKTSKPATGLCSGDKLYLSTPASLSGTVYANFIQVTGALSVPFTAGQAVTIPDGLFGQTYVTLSNVKGGITDASTLAGPVILELPLQNRNFKIQTAL